MSSAPGTRLIADLEAQGAITAIQDGNHGESHPKASEYVVQGIPFIMASDIRDGCLYLEEAKRLPKARTDRLRIGFARPGDVLLTHKGTVGEVAMVPEVADYLMLTPQVTYYRTNPKVLDARYLSFAFRSPHFQAQLKNISAQSTRPYVPISTQRRLSVAWHQLAVQHRIASILGAYDDLIEVNRRRIAVLEEMARRLFEEWFVHFRFPGHGNSASSSPDSWRTLRLADVAQVNAASVKSDAALSSIGYIDISSVSVGSVEKVDWMDFASAPGRARRRVRDGSIIWSMVRPNRRSHAVLIDPDPDTIVSTGFAVLDAKDLPFTYLYQWVTTDSFVGYLSNNATGAAYPAVTGATFERAEILVPPLDLMTKFAEITEPMLRLGAKLRKANAKLAASRDLVLPRLVSGELPVTTAERELEDAA